jgi:hypothetical protein
VEYLEGTVALPVNIRLGRDKIFFEHLKIMAVTSFSRLDLAVKNSYKTFYVRIQ